MICDTRKISSIMHAKVLGHPFIESVNKLYVSVKKNTLDVHMCNTNNLHIKNFHKDKMN